MYFILDCALPLNENGEALMEIHNCFKVGNARNWKNGKPFKPNVSFPIPIEIDYEPYREYNGPPVEMLDICIPIMSKRLKEAVELSGVDNIDFFPAILTNTDTGAKYDYFAFKVIGLIAAADMGSSEFSSFDEDGLIDTSVESLVIDDKKAHALKVFRLAENINALMVNEEVKKFLENSGINTLNFLKPEEFVQL